MITLPLFAHSSDVGVPHRPGLSGLSACLRISTLIMLLYLVAGAAGPGAVAEESLKVQEAEPSAININTASAEMLAAGLNGVGLARAEDIVRHREAYGPFATLEELIEVKGIGKATLERNRAVITLE